MIMNAMNSAANKDDIEKRVVEIVAEKVGIDSQKVVITSSLHNLGIDSLDLVEIVLEIEDSFNCCIDDAKIEQLETVLEMIEYVQGICKK